MKIFTRPPKIAAYAGVILLTATACAGNRKAPLSYGYSETPLEWSRDDSTLLLKRADLSTGREWLLLYNRRNHTYKNPNIRARYGFFGASLAPDAMSIAVSRNAINYAARGVVFICQLPCHLVNRLTNGQHDEEYPRFAPNGESVAYVESGDKLIITRFKPRTNTDVELNVGYTVTNIRWLLRTSIAVIAAIAPPVATRYKVIAEPGARDQAMRIIAAGTIGNTEATKINTDIASSSGIIAYEGNRDKNGYIAGGYGDTVYAHEIYVRNLRTRVTTRLTNTKMSEHDPIISADGKWLAYGTDYEKGGRIRVERISLDALRTSPFR